MMVSHPEKWIKDFKDAGADSFTFHIEAVSDPRTIIQQIRDAGMKVGIALKPKTPVENVIPYVEKVDMVLIMTVEPGFGGQKFMEDMMSKVWFSLSLLDDSFGLTAPSMHPFACRGTGQVSEEPLPQAGH